MTFDIRFEKKKATRYTHSLGLLAGTLYTPVLGVLKLVMQLLTNQSLIELEILGLEALIHDLEVCSQAHIVFFLSISWQAWWGVTDR